MKAGFIADNRETVFLRVEAFDLTDSFYWTLLKRMAAYGICGVSGEYDYTTTLEHVYYTIQITLVGVLVIYSDQHDALSFI